MEFQEFLKVVSNKKQTIVSVVLLFVALTAVLTFIQPFKYSSQTKILVVQTAPEGIDPYQVAKANEYVANTLSKVIISNSFFNEVLNTGFNINKNYFPTDPKKQLKEWKNTVSANSSNNSGLIDVVVFHRDKYQADQIIRGINAVIKEKHQYYHGSGDQVNVRVIDQPFSSSFPVKPNIPVNFATGIIMGLIFALTYIYLFPEKSYNLSLYNKKRKKYEDEVDDDEQEIRKMEVKEAISRLHNRSIESVMEPEHIKEDIQQNLDYQNQQRMRQEYYARKNSQRIAERKIPDKNETKKLSYEDIVGKGDMGNVF